MKNKILKNLSLCIFAFLLYFIATYPTRNIFTVFSVTDVRPGAALNPLLSMCFGPPAILGLTIATTLGDYLSGYPTLVLFQGIILQYLYGILSYLTWKHLTKDDHHRYRLDSLAKILKFTAVALVYAISSGLGVAYIVATNFGGNVKETLGFVFLNNFDFTMMLGMPLLILANLLVHKHASGELRKLSRNEIMILCSVLTDFISLGLIIFFTYRGFSGTGADIYTIWNTVYIRGAIAINCILIITGISIFLTERLKG